MLPKYTGIVIINDRPHAFIVTGTGSFVTSNPDDLAALATEARIACAELTERRSAIMHAAAVRIDEENNGADPEARADA